MIGVAANGSERLALALGGVLLIVGIFVADPILLAVMVLLVTRPPVRARSPPGPRPRRCSARSSAGGWPWVGLTRSNGPMESLDHQVAFLLEADRLKTVLRQSTLTDRSRRENSAEHSWHLALMVLVLAEYAPPGTDLGRVMAMVVLHDLVPLPAETPGSVQAKRQAQERARAMARELVTGVLFRHVV